MAQVYIFTCYLCVLIVAVVVVKATTRNYDDELCFPILGDFGGLPHHPYQTSSQKKIANLLAKVTAKLNCKFVIGVGDNFYFDGVKNLADPRFFTTYERTYHHPSLQIPWYMIAGNHDHVQNVTAQILYSDVSKRWKFPNFYYSFVHSIPKSKKTVEVLMLDTTMLCWHNKKSGAPSSETQWKWIENKLNQSKANFLIVAGHHPIYSAGSHGNTPCLQQKLKPLLERYDVTAYFSGHDHNLQHLKEPSSNVHYFVSGSGNFVDSRMTNKNKLPPFTLKFMHGLFGGFILACANNNFIEITITNDVPKKLYKLKLKPRNINLLNKTIKPKTILKPNLKLITTNKNQRLTNIPSSNVAQFQFMPLLNNRIENIATNPREAVHLEEARSFIPRMQSNIDEQLQQTVYWSSWLPYGPHK